MRKPCYIERVLLLIKDKVILTNIFCFTQYGKIIVSLEFVICALRFNPIWLFIDNRDPSIVKLNNTTSNYVTNS